MNELKMFTTEEVAEILGMRPEHVRDLRKIGVLEAIKTGKNYMFSKASLLEFQERYKGKDVSNVKAAVQAMCEIGGVVS